MSGLDLTQQRLLENAPDNPNSPQKPDVGKARPGLGFSKSTTGPPKPSLKDALQRQKAAMAKNMQARPGSAMSSFTPSRTVSTSSTVSSKSDASTSLRSEAINPKSGGLSVAPVRPAQRMKRVDPPRPQTAAGTYPVRRPGHTPTNSESAISPSTSKTIKTRAPSVSSSTNSPSKRAAQPVRPNTSHSNHAPSHASPTRSSATRNAPSAKTSPVRTRPAPLPKSSPTKDDEELTMVMPSVGDLRSLALSHGQETTGGEEPSTTPRKVLKVYEDPFSSTDDPTTPRPFISAPVLSEVQVNDDNTKLAADEARHEKTTPLSPERTRQNARLLDSGINKIMAHTLDGHGFRKLQGMIRDNKADLHGERRDALVSGLFGYLEAPMVTMTAEKAQDVRAQILSTIKLIYQKEPDAFSAHVDRGLESMMMTRSLYDSQSYLVSGLELFAKELVTLASASDCITTMTLRLGEDDMSISGSRRLSMGLHLLKEILESKKGFSPSQAEVDTLCKLAGRCLESTESRVRMDAVLMCVSMHAILGETRFWDMFHGAREDSKSLLTYYVATKGQRTLAL